MGFQKWGVDPSITGIGGKWGADPFAAPLSKWGIDPTAISMAPSMTGANTVLPGTSGLFSGASSVVAPASVTPPVVSGGGSGNAGYSGGGGSYAPTAYAPTSYGLSVPAVSSSISYVPSAGGGDWAGVDQWDSLVQQVSNQTGVPANVIKSIMQIESQGDPNAMSSQGYYGLMQTGPDSSVPDYMKDYTWLGADPYNQILAGATELQNKYDWVGTGSWADAAGAYLGYGVDANGTSTGQYQSQFQANLDYLNSQTPSNTTVAPTAAAAFSAPGIAQLGVSGAGSGQMPATIQRGGQQGDADPTITNQVLSVAKSYVGVIPYVWGGVPGKGVDPIAFGGWDCSGFTYWLDQNYGNGDLPMGSHYQYQYAIDTGQLFTDLNQLQPGDIVFIDTGWYGGAGGDMNAAGHVGIYAGNGMMIHAANEDVGTIISPLSGYNGQILGAMHQPWSGSGLPDIRTTPPTRTLGLFSGQPAATPTTPVATNNRLTNAQPSFFGNAGTAAQQTAGFGTGASSLFGGQQSQSQIATQVIERQRQLQQQSQQRALTPAPNRAPTPISTPAQNYIPGSTYVPPTSQPAQSGFFGSAASTAQNAVRGLFGAANNKQYSGGGPH